MEAPPALHQSAVDRFPGLPFRAEHAPGCLQGPAAGFGVVVVGPSEDAFDGELRAEISMVGQ